MKKEDLLANVNKKWKELSEGVVKILAEGTERILQLTGSLSGKSSKRRSKGGPESDQRSGSTSRQRSGSSSRRRSGRRKPDPKERAVEILKGFAQRYRLILILIGLFLIISVFYSKIIKGKTWMNHTKINGVDVSGKTMEETLALLPDGSDYQLDIHGRDGGEITMEASDIDYQLIPDQDQLAIYFRNQHGLIVFPWSSHKYKVETKTSYDPGKLTHYLDNCLLIKGGADYTITAPVSADISYSEKQGMPVIKKEVKGNTLNKTEFYKIVKDAVDKRLTEIDLTDQEAYPAAYESPRYTRESEEIQNGLKEYNSYINRYISWEMWEGETYTISPKQIIPIVYYSGGQMSYRVYKLEKLIRKFCDKYQTAGKEREFTTHKGKTVKIKKGDYGWKLDYDKVLDQAETALTQKLDEAAVNAYMQDPSKENKKAVTITLKPQYKTEAFKIDYDNYQDWDPDNYTEASIKEQMVYVHRKGKIVYECKTISGLPVEGRETGKGVYYVKGRSKDRVLKGDDYETPVKYWIRLTQSGTGFHAAPWQKWDKWSPTYYKKHGSHGCLNLSDKDAKKMYEILEDGEAVFIY